MITSARTARRVAFVLAASMMVLALGACGGSGGGETPPTPPTQAKVASITVTPLPPTLYVGATAQLVVKTLDANGAVLSGRTISYSSNNDAIAWVTTAGTVTATGAGSTIIHVSCEGVLVDVTVNVALVPVISVVVTPASTTIGLNGTAQLSFSPRDSVGGVLSGRSATWSTSASGIATVSQAGVVTGVSAGTAVIRATVDGKFGESTITVSSASAPSITSISPAMLTPGVTATINGANFGSGASGNTVTIDGVASTIVSASTTQLTVAVPDLPCLPTHSAPVQVITQGLGGTTMQPVRAGTVVTVASQTPLLLSPTEAACAELPAATGQFVVSVFDVAKAPGIDQSATTAFRLSGSLPPASVASVLSPAVSLRQKLSMPGMRQQSPLGADPLLRGVSEETSERLHESMLESDRAVYMRMRAAGRTAHFARSAAHRSIAPSGRSATALPAIGETRKFRVAQFTTALNAIGSCSNFVEVTARAVYVGSHAVLYEDVAAPLANTMDSYFRSVGTEFDNSMYAVDSTYFGDPLITDSGTDADGHLNMVFTPSITKGVAGFVTSCDFFPRDSSGNPNTEDRESNFGEYFYAVVPTVAGTGFSSNTADQWLRGMRHTIVHEVKHIASFGARLTNNASTWEEAWLEEGMARHAEELWERNYIYNVAWKGNSAYRETMYCDVRPTFTECAGRPFGMFSHFSTLYNVLADPGASSIFGRVADNDFNFYASSWSLVRYSLDRYATNEASFLRGITQSSTTAGIASISNQTGGHSAEELLTNWSLAMYFDDVSTNPNLNFPTWNSHDIYAGIKNDFPSTYANAFPLVPLGFPSANFAVENGGIHTGSFAMYLVPANASGPSTIRLSSPGNAGAAPTALRLALVRTP